MFRRLHQLIDPVRLDFEGREVLAERGDSVAAALLAAGEKRFCEALISGQARAPLCMIGNCFDCLIEIDGEPNRQACRTEVAEGMRVRIQRQLPGVADDES